MINECSKTLLQQKPNAKETKDNKKYFASYRHKNKSHK